MEGMALNKVYITQDAVGRNFLPAKQWGEPVLIMPANAQVILTAAPTVRRMKQVLAKFCDEDYLLLSGDPLIMGVALTIACSVNMGKAKLLKWDKNTKVYYDVKLNLHEKEETYD